MSQPRFVHAANLPKPVGPYSPGAIFERLIFVSRAWQHATAASWTAAYASYRCCVSEGRSGHIELWAGSGAELLRLDQDRITIGKAAENDVVLDDSMVSRLHAVVERYASGWVVRDLGSRNGTYVNGDRIVGDRALRPGDEIRLGETKLTYRAAADDGAMSATRTQQQAPEITKREHEVLVELCRPALTGSMLSEPATLREIAEALVVTESAVKKHLGRLYDKFGLFDDGDRRRGRLAAEAIRSGAVGIHDARPDGA
jgi:DNA-binding CsgD family transcriptional regulator